MIDMYAALIRHDAEAWTGALEAIGSDIHPVDREATRIWFAFFPLVRHLRTEHADEVAGQADAAGVAGTPRLAEQAGTSHRFLYAHRYWPQVKAAIQAWRGPASADLATTIGAIADAAGRTARVDREMLLGIGAVLLMTLRQAGPRAFEVEAPTIHLSHKARAMSPHQVLRARARDDSQGLFGFVRGARRRWSVTFDEADPSARFSLIDGQTIAEAALADGRDYHSLDPRCAPHAGPLPSGCGTDACGCWVGVLGGAGKLSPVDERERTQLRACGYLDALEERPLIRLACQARAHGAISIVIPPWNVVAATAPTRP